MNKYDYILDVAKGKMYKEINDKIIDIQYIVGSYLETQQPTITEEEVCNGSDELTKYKSQLNAIKQVVEKRLFEDYISDVEIKIILSILKEEEK